MNEYRGCLKVAGLFFSKKKWPTLRSSCVGQSRIKSFEAVCEAYHAHTYPWKKPPRSSFPMDFQPFCPKRRAANR